MSTFFTSRVGLVTVSTGTTKSNMITRASYEDANSLILQSPASIDAKTYTILITTDLVPDIVSGNWATLVDSAGANVTPAALAKARGLPVEIMAATAFYILASANTGINVSFSLSKQYLSPTSF